MANFLETTLPKIATPVHRLGLSASYWPGKAAVHRALDEGLNYFFLFGFDRQTVKGLREALPRVTGSVNRVAPVIDYLIPWPRWVETGGEPQPRGCCAF